MSASERQARGLGGRLRRLASVRVAVPLLVGIGLLAYVIGIALAPESGEQIWRIFRGLWWLVLLLTFPYLAIRALVWRDLLEQLRIEVPWRPLLVAFAGGEITKNLPAGIYVQNYLLARLEHFREPAVARTSMASTAMLGLEAALAVPVGAIVGWPGAPWVRWALLGVIAVWVAALGLAWLLVHLGARHLPARAPDWLQSIIRFLDDFLAAGGELLTRRTARDLLPTALYMLVYVVYFYAIARVLGLQQVDWLQALGIHAFVILSVILVPIPTEIGLTEFTGLAALVAYGIPQATAAIMMLGLRALATGMTILVASALLLILRGEWAGNERPVKRAGASRP